MCDIEGTLIGTKEFECDKCGYRELVFDGTVTHLNFCPNCGADMRDPLTGHMNPPEDET